MIFKTFGDKKNKAIMLIHGGGLSWWSFRPHIETLMKDYYIITPIIDGHGDNYMTQFSTISDCGDKIIAYINSNHNGKIFALCGLSIGGQIVVDVLTKKAGICENAVIESALVYPMKLTSALISPMLNMSFGLIKKRWFSKYQARALFVPENMIEQYYIDSIKISKKSLLNMSKCNSDFSMPESLNASNAKALIIVGSKELPIMIKSAKLLNKTIKSSKLMIIDKHSHGQISLGSPKIYIDILVNFFNERG